MKQAKIRWNILSVALILINNNVLLFSEPIFRHFSAKSIFNSVSIFRFYLQFLPAKIYYFSKWWPLSYNSLAKNDHFQNLLKSLISVASYFSNATKFLFINAANFRHIGTAARTDPNL